MRLALLSGHGESTIIFFNSAFLTIPSLVVQAYLAHSNKGKIACDGGMIACDDDNVCV